MALVSLLRHVTLSFFFFKIALSSGRSPKPSTLTSITQGRPQIRSSIAARSQAFDMQRKVLCIGDSITVGLGDGGSLGHNNGYRLQLYNMLAAAGFNTQFIGTQISGTADNSQPRMEGYGWQTINSILSHIQDDNILDQRPDVILLHAGTNDNDLPQTSNDTSVRFVDAPARLGNLLDFITTKDPDAIVLVAKLIQNKYNQTQTDAFNAQVPVVVSERREKGFKVGMVDMSMVGGDDLLDALHPTAAGYLTMAKQWYDSIMAIPDDWWVTPSNISQTATSSPLPTPTSFQGTDSSQTTGGVPRETGISATSMVSGTTSMPTRLSSATRSTQKSWLLAAILASIFVTLS